MQMYKALLANGWSKENLNKHIKEQLLHKRLKYHQAQREQTDVDDTIKQLQQAQVTLASHSQTDTQTYPLPVTSSSDTIIKLINIDSRFRTNILHTNSNDFIIALNYTMRNVIRMRLHEIEIPNSWYTLSDDKLNNRMEITDHSVFPTEHHKYSVPTGNYDFATLKATLESMESDQGKVFADVATINININTGKVVLSATNNGTISLHFWNTQQIDDTKNEDTDPTLLTSAFGWLLGFRKGEYNMASTHVAESLLDISGTRYIYLCIDDNKTNLNDFVIGNMHSSYLNENVIARITLPNEKYQVINNNTTNIELKHTQTRFYPQPVKIDRLRIKILDEYGKLLDLNGMDISMTLEFTLQNDSIPFLN